MSGGWWDEYQSYLRSPEWQIKRGQKLAVLQRYQGGLCECCGIAKATEVHHLSYKHLGRERLWELRGVCSPCHRDISEEDRAEARERRAATV